VGGGCCPPVRPEPGLKGPDGGGAGGGDPGLLQTDNIRTEMLDVRNDFSEVCVPAAGVPG
jgi:hypothetical protein